MGFGSAPNYHPVNRMAVTEAAIRVNRRNTFDNIMMQGQWTVKKLDFNLNDQVTLRCLVSGVGVGFLYASHLDGDANQILAIKRITPGLHNLQFTVPYPVLREFKIGVSSTIPKGYSIDSLSKETKYKIRTNSMMLSQHTPMYETPGLGFAGLGAALLDLNQPATGGTDDAGNKHWNGNWDNYSWNNGFFGKIDTETVVGNERVPRTIGSYHGYYASKHNLMLAKFDANDAFLGWDAVESSVTSRTLPLGVPMCIVTQYFVLPEFHFSYKKGGDGKEHTSKKPKWDYADGMTPSAKHFCFISNGHSQNMRHKYWGGDPRPDFGDGVIKTVQRHWVTDNKYEDDNGNQTGIMIDGNRLNPSDVAFKVEWYDEVSGTWSKPQVNPLSVPTTNEKGFSKVIFRIPRQLSEETDSDILKELDQFGVDYRHETTKQYFPCPSDNSSNPTLLYQLPNRPLGANEVIDQIDADGYTYRSSRRLGMTFYFGYGKHPKAGHAGNDEGAPKDGATPSEMYFTAVDPAKSARFNNPEMLTAFYPVGGFNAGGVIIAIGKGMSKGYFVMSSKSSFNINPTSDDLRALRSATNSDGSDIGTMDSAALMPAGVILSTDLEDDRETSTETEVLAAWKAKFGVPLTKEFFNKYSFKDQIPERPTHYRARDEDSGLDFEAPYQIIYFKIPTSYNGPYINYELVEETVTNAEGVSELVSKLKITKPEGKQFALEAKDSLFLHTRTPYFKTFKTKLDIVDEVEEQRTLMESGLSAEEALAYNELDNPPDESTASTAEMTQEEVKLRELAPPKEPEEEDLPKLPRGAKYVRSGDKWRLSPKHYARESQLKDAGFIERSAAEKKALKVKDKIKKSGLPGFLGGIKNSLSGFTDSRDFYVEDVTDKWGASSMAGYKGLGAVDYRGLGADSYEENVDDIFRDTGDLIKAAVNSTGAMIGLTYNMLDGDIDGVYDKIDYIDDTLSDANSDDDSVITISANLLRNAGIAVGQKAAGEATDALSDGVELIGDITGLGGYSANGLGDFWDKAEDVGEGVGKFVRGTARGLAPDALTDSVDTGITALGDSYARHPILYTGLALAAVPLIIPGIGGAYARNIGTLAMGTIGLVPKAFRAGVDTISSVSSGAIDGVKNIGSSMVETPSKRGTAARRRRYKRR